MVKTPKCLKFRFPSYQSACRAMLNHSVQVRVYFCPKCQGFHLTSKFLRNWKT